MCQCTTCFDSNYCLRRVFNAIYSKKSIIGLSFLLWHSGHCSSSGFRSGEAGSSHIIMYFRQHGNLVVRSLEYMRKLSLTVAQTDYRAIMFRIICFITVPGSAQVTPSRIHFLAFVLQSINLTMLFILRLALLSSVKPKASDCLPTVTSSSLLRRQSPNPSKNPRCPLGLTPGTPVNMSQSPY